MQMEFAEIVSFEPRCSFGGRVSFRVCRLPSIERSMTLFSKHLWSIVSIRQLRPSVNFNSPAMSRYNAIALNLLLQ